MTENRELGSPSSQDVHREVPTNSTDVTDLGGGVGPLNQSETSLVSETLPGPVEPEAPIDYEEFIEKNRDQMLADPEKHLLFFPEDDVEVFTVPRSHRTTKVPVPEATESSMDPFVAECVKSFKSDWHSIKRKHGSFYGSDGDIEHGYHETGDYLKNLTSHEYEVDMDKQEVLNKEEKASKTSAGNKEFDSTESDELLEDLMSPVYDQEQMDTANQDARQRDHYTKLFSLYQMPSGNPLEIRIPTVLPQEQHGIKVLIKVVEFWLKSTFEPIFMELALYDAKECKKISESFHMDMNSNEMYHMLDDHNGECSMASKSQTAIFSITHLNPDVFLVLRLEKVLQNCDITEAAEPYQLEMDRKSLDKAKSAAKQFCQQLGQYRMPLAWVAFPIVEEIAKEQDAKDEDGTGALLSSKFKPVTIKKLAFYKQDDKITDSNLCRQLAEIRSGNVSKKTVPGALKLDISPPYSNIPYGLTSSSLWTVSSCVDTDCQPVREIEEFPPKPLYYPNIVYKNMLYVYPQSLDFHKNTKGHNIGIKIQFMAGEDPINDALQVIYGRSSGPMFVREAWATVLYHNKNPEYYNEIKIELPAHLTTKHHILFTFYHIKCTKPDPHELPQFLGCTWIPLLEDGELHTGFYNLPISTDKTPLGYSLLKTSVKSNMKWMDHHKPLFKVTTHAVSSLHPQDIALSKYFKCVLERRDEVGTDCQEEELSLRVKELQSAAPEPLVKFLYPVLNTLISLLVRHTMSKATAGAAQVQLDAFATMAHIVNHIQFQLNLHSDKHEHNKLLATYLQHVLIAPNIHSWTSQGLANRNIILGKQGNRLLEKEKVRAGGSMKVYCDKVTTDQCELHESLKSSKSPKKFIISRKLLHEQILLLWLMLSKDSKVQGDAMSVAWFFFGIMIKSMAQRLHKTGNLKTPRKNFFPPTYQNDLKILTDVIAVEIAEKHIKNFFLAKELNTSLAFFFMDALSLMDRGFVFSLIRNYVKKLALAPADYILTEFKLNLLQIVCSHEHYIALNLPLLLSTNPSSISTCEDEAAAYIKSKCTLTKEYLKQHYLTGLVLSELARVLTGRMPKLRELAVALIRDLFASHDANPRYQSKSSRERIAMLYMPLLSIVMDNVANLYHGSEGKDNWASSFEKKIKDRHSFPAGRAVDPALTTPTTLQQLGPESTQSLLLCFLWVLHNIEPALLSHWWSTLPFSRLITLLNVLDLCVACFEYKGKQTISNQSSMSVAMKHISTSGKESKQQRHHGTQSTTSKGTSLKQRSKAAFPSDRSGVSFEDECRIERCLSGEASLIILDTLEALMQDAKELDNMQATLPKALEVLLHLLTCNESVSVMGHIFATQRSVLVKFPNLLLEGKIELSAKLCICLLKHCSSSHLKIRTLACASLYLLMRQNYIIGRTFPRIKVQITVALSSIVASNLKFDEYHLRKSLRTLVTYADSDSLNEVEGTDFPDQVRDLAANLHRILLDTVKMQEANEVPAVLMDLMYRISKGYQKSPDLRLTWLQHMGEKYNKCQQYPEAAMCLIHAAALVAKYLERKPYLPVDCVPFKKISPNVLKEYAIFENNLSPKKEGLCTSDLFSENGMIRLLELAVVQLMDAHFYEVVYEVYQIIIPIHSAKKHFKELQNIHTRLSDCFKNIVSKGDRRGFGSYYRVGFYGAIFGEDIDRQEFIYREQGFTRLAEFSLKLGKSYFDKYGSDHIVMITDSNKVQSDQLDPNKGYIQITYLEPYFDEDELELPERSTLFDRNYNVRRFVYSTPFTKSGKAHGNISDQYMRKTILTTEECFPYIRSRIKVQSSEELELTPVEVAIEDMRVKNNKLKEVTSNAQDIILLQMELQGSIATSVNQGPSAIAQAFLGDVPPSQQNHFHQQLRTCFQEFIKLCGDALSINKARIQEEQLEYQQEMERKYQELQELLGPLISTGRKMPPRGAQQLTSAYLKKITTMMASRAAAND